MILKTFKEKSNKRYLNKILSKRQVNVGDNNISSLGIIINIDEVEDFEFFRSLANVMKVRPDKVKIIAFTTEKGEGISTWDACYNSKHLGFNGTIKNEELKNFLNKEFDALISYYTNEDLELKMLTVLSKAQFKIGILQTDSRLNDLIIKAEINEFDVFKNEVFKYLTILNKI